MVMGRASRAKRDRRETGDNRSRLFWEGQLEVPSAALRALWAHDHTSAAMTTLPGALTFGERPMIVTSAKSADDGRVEIRGQIAGKPLTLNLPRGAWQALLSGDPKVVEAAMVSDYQQRVANGEAEPIWAGADGFTRTWEFCARQEHLLSLAGSEQVLHARSALEDTLKTTPDETITGLASGADERLQELVHRHDLAEAAAQAARYEAELLKRQARLLADLREYVIEHRSETENSADPSASKPKAEPDGSTSAGISGPAAPGGVWIAEQNLAALRSAVPIVFDPLLSPQEAQIDELADLRLPFDELLLDFLSPTGMTLPVVSLSGRDTWCGLVCASVRRDVDGTVWIWPTVTTMSSARADDEQIPDEMIVGCVRIGAPAAPPAGIHAVEPLADHPLPDHVQVWMWDQFVSSVVIAGIWVLAPALHAIGALKLLEAVNITLDRAHSRAIRRQAQREHQPLALRVQVASHVGGRSRSTNGDVRWSHRWTVRGHYKHFGEHTRLAQSAPWRVVEDAEHGRHVKVWCPPHIKGPEGRPLVQKAREKRAS
jgi:hypothetical protein